MVKFGEDESCDGEGGQGEKLEHSLNFIYLEPLTRKISFHEGARYLDEK